jgi:hypothetical protein
MALFPAVAQFTVYLRYHRLLGRYEAIEIEDIVIVHTLLPARRLHGAVAGQMVAFYSPSRCSSSFSSAV